MSKEIQPHELSELVSALLINPSLLGQLDENRQYCSFMQDIGQVVADHCGGYVNCCRMAEPKEADGKSFPYLSVSPDSSLPSLRRNVWSYHDSETDNDGWQDESAEEYGIDEGTALTQIEVRSTREKMQALLVEYGIQEGFQPSVSFNAQDWRILENAPLEEAGDDMTYGVKVNLGQQSSAEVSDQYGDPIFGLHFEIDHGIPILRVDLGDSPIIRLAPLDGGMLVSAQATGTHWSKAIPNRFNAYMDKSYIVHASNGIAHKPQIQATLKFASNIPLDEGLHQHIQNQLQELVTTFCNQRTLTSHYNDEAALELSSASVATIYA